MALPREDDFPKGHPKRVDYDPRSPEAAQWARENAFPFGERDFPRGHVKAVDTDGNQNHVQHIAGIDPLHPELEQFTGRTPEQAEAVRQFNEELAKESKETIPPEPIIAPEPPPPGDISLPVGQPGSKTA
jgi:hypothetical protein